MFHVVLQTWALTGGGGIACILLDALLSSHARMRAHLRSVDAARHVFESARQMGEEMRRAIAEVEYRDVGK